MADQDPKDEVERLRNDCAALRRSLQDAHRCIEQRGQLIADAMGRYRGTEALVDAVRRLAQDYERSQGEVAELRAWQQTATDSHARLDAMLRQLVEGLPQHYGMPQDGVRITVGRLLHGFRATCEEAERNGLRHGAGAWKDGLRRVDLTAAMLMRSIGYSEPAGDLVRGWLEEGER